MFSLQVKPRNYQLIMNVKTYNLLILCVVVSFSSLSFAEYLTVTPAQCFLHGNQTVTLNWRYHSEKLKEKHFDKDFAFFHNETKLENEGGGATMVVPGKPYVDYELRVNKPGLYIGKVDGVNTTAVVYTVKSEANSTSAARSGDNLNLTCVDGPEEAVILWEVDGGSVGHGVSKKYRENNDGSLTVVKIELPDALRRIGCRIFFTPHERDEYKKNKSNIPGYRTALIAMPVLVYNTSRHSESESLFILQVASWKDGVTVRGLKNSSVVIKEVDVNVSSVDLDRDSNFTIFMNQNLLVMDHYKAPEESVNSDKEAPKASNNLVTVLVVVAVFVVLIVSIAALVWARKTKKLCWKETPHDTSVAAQDILERNNETAVPKTPCWPVCCFKKDAKDNDRNSKEMVPFNTDGAEQVKDGIETEVKGPKTPCWPVCCFKKDAKDNDRNSKEEKDGIETEVKDPMSI